MSLKAIITTLILGSSSLALAAPGEYTDVRDHRTEEVDRRQDVDARPAIDHRIDGRTDGRTDDRMDGRTDDRMDGRTDGRTDAREHREGFRSSRRPMPVTLASSTRIQGRDVIRVNESLRPFTKLELRSNNGRTRLDKVVIMFGNGQSQVVDCNTQLNGKESFSIDLTGNARNIKRIVLSGSSGRRASVDVIAV